MRLFDRILGYILAITSIVLTVSGIHHGNVLLATDGFFMILIAIAFERDVTNEMNKKKMM